MIVSVDEFNAYSGNFEDKAEVVTMKTLLIQSAQETVESYLRYKLEGEISDEVKDLWDKETAPQSIKLMILKVATLMLTESNSNIGITGRSFGDNSRTFIQNTNYEKYLRQISVFRLSKF